MKHQWMNAATWAFLYIWFGLIFYRLRHYNEVSSMSVLVIHDSTNWILVL